MFTTTAYNTLGEVQESETQNDSWTATEMCLDSVSYTHLRAHET